MVTRHAAAGRRPPATGEENAMKAKVDKDLCCGCGPCEAICPEVFVIENNVAVVKGDTVPPDAADRCKEAMESCPTGAISVEP
jgi:ferredoxin